MSYATLETPKTSTMHREGKHSWENGLSVVFLFLFLVCVGFFWGGEVLMVSNSGILSLACFLVLLLSYALILITLRTHLHRGQSKALSTCASHLTVVSLIFVPCVFIYLRPFCTFSVDKVVSVFYTVITPMLNPLIYTLRNADMKRAIGKLRKKQVASHCFGKRWWYRMLKLSFLKNVHFSWNVLTLIHARVKAILETWYQK